MDYRRLIDMDMDIKDFETKLELLDYPNPEGLHPVEASWRDFARTLRDEITRLKSFGCELDKNYIRIDDPVVTGLVEALRNFEQTCYSRDNYLQAHKALSAYEARVKEVSRE